MDLEVETPFGRLRGHASDGVTAYRGVPYAHARRFEMPGPPPRWSSVRDASRPGTIPPQNPSRLDAVMGAYDAPQSEDCLHVDIWTTHRPGARAPVLVFIHGGGFMTGGGSLPCYDGSVLARENGLVVVNISYRLGVFGFWPGAALGPANLGLHDQVAALRWIHEAIACFGGDPERVAISGQSAGGFSVAAHLAAGLGPKLFRRAFMMSAPLGLELRSLERATPHEAALVDGLGLRNAKALRDMPVDEVFTRLRGLEKNAAGVPGDITPPFMPVVDGDILPGPPLETLRARPFDGCDVMIGVTREELAAFYVGNPRLDGLTDDALRELFRHELGGDADATLSTIRSERVPATPRALLADLHTDRAFLEPSLELAAVRRRQGGKAFAYIFDWAPPGSPLAACHCLDLPFLYGNTDVWKVAPMLQGADLREVNELGRRFRGAVAAFVADGDPNAADLPRWPAFGEGRIVLHVDRRITASSHLG